MKEVVGTAILMFIILMLPVMALDKGCNNETRYHTQSNISIEIIIGLFVLCFIAAVFF